MPQQSRAFCGEWITLPLAAELRPVEVFHRQLSPMPIDRRLPENLHILFRKSFSLQNTAEKIHIHITADDYYKLYINGRFVSQGPAPGFPFHYYYNTLDITDFVHAGENTLAIHTYYQGLINRVWVSGDDRHGLLFDLVQGERVLACSDQSVKCRLHDGFMQIAPCGYDTQFLERYDSRADCVGFERVGFDDSGWEAAALRRYADYRFFPQPTAQLTSEQLRPVRLIRGEKSCFADFGSIYVGYLTLTAQGYPGQKVNIYCGQELTEDGRVRYEMRASTRYAEEWILSGGQDSLDWFDYKSFRYVQIESDAPLEIDGIGLTARHYPFTNTRTCQYSEPALRQVWDLCVRSLHYGVQEVIQDCMEREKGQYLGDGALTSAALTVLTGDASIMEKLIDEALRTSFIDEGLMICSPCSFMQEIAEYPLMLPHLLAAHRRLTGDTAFLRERYHALTQMLDSYAGRYAAENGLIGNLDKWCVVDWPAEARDDYDFDLVTDGVAPGVHNVINAYYIGAIKMMNKLADILQLPPYRETASLERAFCEAFYDPARHLFRDTPESSHISLPGNAFALLFGLYPTDEAAACIVDLIARTKPDRVAFFTTFACLAGLTRLGQEEACKALLSDEGRWLRMIREGATVTFEAWGKDAKWNTSLFHLCYSYAVLFLTDWGMEDCFV